MHPTPFDVTAPAIRPVEPASWSDLVALFGPRGACAGCCASTPG